MFGFKEVCFVAGGVDFLGTLRYSHNFYIIFTTLSSGNWTKT